MSNVLRAKAGLVAVVTGPAVPRALSSFGEDTGRPGPVAQLFFTGPPATPEAAMTERRAAPRHRAWTGRLFRVQSPDGQALTYGLMVDVSAAGVLLLAGRPVPAGPAELVP